MAATTPFARREVGPNGAFVGELGLGTGPLGGLPGRPLDDETADATLVAAWAAGIRYFDTAPWYGLGLSEHRVGRFLRAQPRDSYLVSTKVGRLLTRPAAPRSFRPRVAWSNPLPFEWRFDYSREAVLRSFEDSLQRLGVNRIDLALIHDVEPAAHGGTAAVQARFRELDDGGGFAALEELRAGGAIDGIGVGLNQAEAVLPFLERFDVDVVLLAGRYTLIEQGALAEALPACWRRGVGMIAGAVFNSGILAGGAGPGATYDYDRAPAEIVERVRRLTTICRRHDVELVAAALQFPLGHPAVVSVLAGAASPDEARTNATAFTQPIPSECWLELRSEGLVDPRAPLSVDAVDSAGRT